MYYGEIKKTDIANGFGVRVSLFVSGCNRHCKNCFNSETWDFSYGQPFTDQTESELMDALAPSFINGLSLLGGEPFEPQNQYGLLPLLKRVKQQYPNKTIWCYTGCTLEDDLLREDSPYHCDVTDALLDLLDVLVDGPFVEELKDISLPFRGSSNQRILDVKRTLKTHTAVLWDGSK